MTGQQLSAVSMPEATSVMKIDVSKVIRDRLPRYSRFIPRFLVAGLERMVRQDGLNALLMSNAGRTGSDFCSGVLADLGVTYNIICGEHMPAPADTRVVYVSNHPLGGLDGIALIDMVARHHGKEPWFVVNDLLMAVEPLRSVFVPVNKHGGQSRDLTVSLNAAFESDRPVIIFPAGLVSRRSAHGIADLEWRKMAVNKAVEHGRDIIPLYFGGRNSSFFYNFAKFRTLSGMKFNIEMALLPAEVFKSAGSRFPVVVGRRVPVSTLAGGRSAEAETQRLRHIVYSLSDLASPDK